MKAIEPSFEILDHVNGMEMLRKIEVCGRVCVIKANHASPKIQQ